MAQKKELPVIIRHSEDGQNEGILNITQFDQSDRIKRALKGLGVTWGFAVVSVMIPIAHWILVPGFFIAGPIVAYVRYSVTHEKENVAGSCPHCKEETSFELEPNDRFPKWTHCSRCNASVQLLDIKK